MILKATEKLRINIEKEAYKGYDPYDALKSPFFKLPVLKSNKLIRFGTQQLVKRFPFNLRPLLLVPKGNNPVTLGLCIQGYAYLIQKEPENKLQYLTRIQELTQELEKLIPSGFSGACWGYDFDWEARYAKIPAYQPTVVATGIITNGLFEAWKVTGNDELKKLIVSAADFVLKDLKRTYKGNTFCFSYSPFDTQKVLNASMKGARLLAQAFHLTGNENYLTEGSKAVDFVVNEQRKNGSWGYSLASSGGWTDNYHTGYVLDCLDTYMQLASDRKYEEALKAGYIFYKDHFFTKEGVPKFYYNKIFPIDCTSGAQSILTLCRFGDLELSGKVAEYLIKNMQSKKGGFYFRKYQSHTERTVFMRWSNAWMFAALSFFLIQFNSD